MIVGYLDAVRHLIAWCELRQDFRDFRTDGVIEAEFLVRSCPERPSALKAKRAGRCEPAAARVRSPERLSTCLKSPGRNHRQRKTAFETNNDRSAWAMTTAQSVPLQTFFCHGRGRPFSSGKLSFASRR